jgi:hypothetical protein
MTLLRLLLLLLLMLLFNTSADATKIRRKN